MLPFQAKVINTCIASCDERISAFEDKLNDIKLYGNVMSLIKLEIEANQIENARNYEISIKIIQVEKLIYNALLKTNNKALFPRLLNKYDEFLGSSIELSGSWVVSGFWQEGEHLDWCKECLDQREYIKKLCFYGENK